MTQRINKQKYLTIILIFIATIIGGWGAISRIFHTSPPTINECYQGKELSLINGSAVGRDFFLGSDEANYLRGAEQIAHGQTVTDFNGAMISAISHAPFDAQVAQNFPPYDVAYQLGKDSPLNKPLFISYRSVVFPILGAPFVLVAGCNTFGLQLLRYETAFFRVLLTIAAALLAFSMSINQRVLQK